MSGLKLFQFDISPKSPDSFIILTSNFSIGGNSGNGNLYFRWRFSSGNRVEYVSVNNKDVSGANRITGGWGSKQINIGKIIRRLATFHSIDLI